MGRLGIFAEIGLRVRASVFEGEVTADPVVRRMTPDDRGRQAGRIARMGVGYSLKTSAEMNRGTRSNCSCRTFVASVKTMHSSPMQKTTLFIVDDGSSCGNAHCRSPSLGNLAVHRRLFGGSHG